MRAALPETVDESVHGGGERRARVTLGALVAGLGLLLYPARAHAQGSDDSPDALVAARALFAEALGDESKGQFAQALQKFERVRSVRDTAPVEYRIASCREGLGDPVGAFVSYRAAVARGRDDPQSADLVQAAGGRLGALADRVARLTLVLPRSAPLGAEVRVDGAIAEAAAEGSTAEAGRAEAVVLAPGRHRVSATAPGAAPYQSEIALAAGAQVSLTVTLEPAPAALPPAPPSTPGASTTGGWIGLAGGAALLATSAALLVARHDAIGDLDRACPGGLCQPGADANELDATRSRALLEGPLALGFAVGGVIAAAVGTFLLVGAGHPSAPANTARTFVPFAAPGGGGLAWVGAFR